MATIQNRGPYQWQARIRRRGYPVQSKTFETKVDAQTWARSIENEMDRGVFVSRIEAERTTLRECLERYAREVTEYKKGNQPEFSRIRILLRQPFASYIMANVRSSDIASFRDMLLRKGRQPATVVHYLAILSHLFNTARREWGMESISNPVELVKKPTVRNSRNRRLEEGEEEMLLEACRNQGNVWLEPLVILAIETAMRKSELLNMRWEHVDFKKRGVHLPDTKNGESRDVPLSSRAIKVLKSLPRSFSGQVLCTSSSATRKAFIKARKQAGLKNLRFHDSRHEATSRLAQLYEIQDLSKVTGHKDMKMLMRYNHPRVEDLAKILS